VYVGLVATHPDHQRKGYAEAVMRRSIEEGQAGFGLTRTTLHASEAGRPLYEAMGYDVGPRFNLVVEPHE
jgi:GNAT superfamily N-acetyltransferase